jgi:hypothetical protein
MCSFFYLLLDSESREKEERKGRNFGYVSSRLSRLLSFRKPLQPGTQCGSRDMIYDTSKNLTYSRLHLLMITAVMTV